MSLNLPYFLVLLPFICHPQKQFYMTYLELGKKCKAGTGRTEHVHHRPQKPWLAAFWVWAEDGSVACMGNNWVTCISSICHAFCTLLTKYFWKTDTDYPMSLSEVPSGSVRWRVKYNPPLTGPAPQAYSYYF
jgi:hypothetical protein